MTRLWRISDHADLVGEGGRRFSARWHTAGAPIVYCAEHPAGALVEHLVHLDWDLLPDSFQFLTIETEDRIAVKEIAAGGLPSHWRTDLSITRAIGDAWLSSASHLLLRVPSVILPDTWNVLFNPSHVEAPSAKIVKAERVPLDNRYIRR